MEAVSLEAFPSPVAILLVSRRQYLEAVTRGAVPEVAAVNLTKLVGGDEAGAEADA